MSNFPEIVKTTLTSIISDMARNPDSFVKNPGSDFTRHSRLCFENIVNMILSMGGQSISQELLDFFQMVAPEVPTASAFVQQRAKILPDAFQHIFQRLNGAFPPGLQDPASGLALVACDGTDVSFAGSSRDTEYFSHPGRSSKGCCSVHVSALYSLDSRRYLDALAQPCHGKDEFRAFCDMVDRFPRESAPNTLFIADRGFASFNVYAHIIEKGAFFLVRSKDAGAKGLVGRLGLPQAGEFDVTVPFNLVRRNTKAFRELPGVTRFIGKKVSFDPVAYGSDDVYHMELRIVRFRLPGGGYECVVTNLPADRFPPEELRRIYGRRWGVETSFRELKYAVGMLNFHCRKPEFILQEIWAGLVLYNFCEIITTHVVVEKKSGTKHAYQLNYTMAIQICHKFLKLLPSAYQPDVEGLIRKYLLPVRESRKFRRKNSKYGHIINFIYRVA